MSTGVGARALGMGGAHVAITTDVTAGYWNPAGLISLKNPQLALMHSERFSGIVKYDYGAFGMPLANNQALAFSMIRLAVDDIPITALEDPDLPLSDLNRPYVAKTVNDAEYAFYFSYAKLNPGKFSYGANLKFIRKGVGDYSAWGMGLDIGMLMNPISNLLFGVNLQDATTTFLVWDTQSNELEVQTDDSTRTILLPETNRKELISPTLKFGFAYPVKLPFLSSKIIPAIDIDTRFENRGSTSQASLGSISFDLHAGLEYTLYRALAFRVGSDVGQFSAGAGIKLPQLFLDYAFMSHDLGTTHRISLRISIEKNKFKR